MKEPIIETISPWIDNLPYRWSEIEKNGKPVYYESQQHVFFSGDPANHIYIVKNGRARLYLITADGKEKAMAIIGSNGIIGDCQLNSSGHHFENAITVSPTELIKIPSDFFQEALSENPELIKQWTDFLQLKICLLSQSNLHISFGNSLHRICNALYHLVKVYGFEDEDGFTINMTFTHQELASLIGTTRVTVANTLNFLISQAVLKKKGKQYQIPDIHKLIEFSEI